MAELLPVLFMFYSHKAASQRSGHGPDAGLLHFEVLELAGRLHLILGQEGQALTRKVGPAGIADQNRLAFRARRVEPGQDLLGQRLLVADVAGEDHVRLRSEEHTSELQSRQYLV